MGKSITPKVIFIDWNKTLSYSLFWEHLADPSHKYHHYHGQIVTWLFTENKHHLTPWMRGLISSREVLTLIEQELDIPFRVLEQELKKSCRNMQLCDQRIPQLVQKIRKKGIKVVIATDNMDTFRETIEALNLKELFDDFLISSEMGILKDDQMPNDSIRFFDGYLTRYNYSYKQAVLIDDSPDSSGKYAMLGFRRVVVASEHDLLNTLDNYASA